MKCIILCGGRGTRLGSLTDFAQKCMLDVGGKPFLYYLVKKLKKAKYEIVFAVDYHGFDVIDYFDASSKKSKFMYYFSNKGQVEAINDWRRFNEENVLFVNGDTIVSGYDYTSLETVLLKEDKGLYRSAGIYYPYQTKEPLSTMEEVFLATHSFTVLSNYEMFEINTPESLEHARANVEKLKC